MTADSEDLRSMVARAVTRDPDAWDVLYRRAYPRLFAYARRRMSTDEAADDAVSEAMTRAIAAIERFTWEGAGFDAWLYGILRNVVYEGARRRARSADGTDIDLVSPEPGPLERVMAAEQAVAVRLAFARLAPPDQELLELRVVGGLSADEVAHVVGKRPGAVRMSQARALGRLRQAMKEVSGADR